VANTIGIAFVTSRAAGTSVEEGAKMTHKFVVLEVVEFAQANPQRLDPISPRRNGAKGQEAHVPYLIALLRPRRERPRRRDAEQ
jgi:hypothetical protein